MVINGDDAVAMKTKEIDGGKEGMEKRYGKASHP